MDSPRTPAQIAADENLTEAIQQCKVAYYGEPPTGIISLMTDYIVVYVNQGFNEGTEGSGMGWLLRESNLPMYRALGMLRLASREIEARWLASQFGDTT